MKRWQAQIILEKDGPNGFGSTQRRVNVEVVASNRVQAVELIKRQYNPKGGFAVREVVEKNNSQISNNQTSVYSNAYNGKTEGGGDGPGVLFFAIFLVIFFAIGWVLVNIGIDPGTTFVILLVAVPIVIVGGAIYLKKWVDKDDKIEQNRDGDVEEHSLEELEAIMDEEWETGNINTQYNDSVMDPADYDSLDQAKGKIDALKSLADLKEKGVLSYEEFQNEKRKLLSD